MAVRAKRRTAARVASMHSHHNPPSAIAIAALILSIMAVLIAMFAVYGEVGYTQYLQKQLSMDNTTATATASATHGLTGLGKEFNATELSTINNAPDAYFEEAGMMFLNGTLSNPVLASSTPAGGTFTINGKPSVIYLGATTCVYCAENRWAMALALSRFGSFGKLYYGYSSLGDGDVPTVFWSQDNYNTSAGMDTNASYSSSYINFLPFEDEAPLKGGFSIQPLQTMQAFVNNTGNATKIAAFNYIIGLQGNSTTAFSGTPYTIWGNSLFKGADAVDFGNSTPTGTTLDIALMTHAEILKQFASPKDQFAWTEYAAADVYIAGMCEALNNTAPVCALPAITAIQQKG